jgi:CAAX protease family protein
VFLEKNAPAETRRATIALALVWSAFVVLALLALEFGNLVLYGIGVPVVGLALAVICARLDYFRSAAITWARWKIDRGDLAAVAVFYVAVVALFKLAFAGFGTTNTLWFFLSFAAGMLVGVAGPIVYFVWIRHRPLAALGIGLRNLPSTAALAVVFAVAQFAVTLWNVRLPQPLDWVPLLSMALAVGVFEAVFFRGFIQGTLEPMFGAAPALAIAAGLYAVYHFGYGMAPSDMLFLFGLGVVYTVAYRITNNLIVIWPLLTPLGSFYAQVTSGELSGQLPWISILGFADVAALMAVAILLGARHEHRRERTARPSAAAAG